MKKFIKMEEVTWERGSEMRRKYPKLFLNTGKNLISRTRFI
jgi:hypothetical protein